MGRLGWNREASNKTPLPRETEDTKKGEAFPGQLAVCLESRNFSRTTIPNAGRDRAISCTTTPSLGLEGPSLILGDYIRDWQGPSLFLGHSHTTRQGPSLFRCHSYHRRYRGRGGGYGKENYKPGVGMGGHVDSESTKRVSKCVNVADDSM